MLRISCKVSTFEPPLRRAGGHGWFADIRHQQEAINGRIAPMAVVPGSMGITRIQTFAQIWRQLLRCLLRGKRTLYAIEPIVGL